MKTTLATLVVVAAALAQPALAQAAAPAAAAKDPFVPLREDQRAAHSAYALAAIAAYAERGTRLNAAVEAAVKDADAKGKDPLVAKRDADAGARKATQPETDAALKKAAADREAALAEADKRFKAAGQ